MSRVVAGLSFALVATVSMLLGVLAGGGGTIPLSRHALAASSYPPALFADIVERVNPAVVNITVLEEGERDSHVAHFPGDNVRRGEGSGFVVDPQGYILTNQHVVATPARIRVRFADKRELTARLVGSDPSTDLALLKVDAHALPSVPLGDSDHLRVGEWVCAIGNPYRFDHSVTVGVVSSKGRKIYDDSFDAYIQTDAAINPGNSGGPLINTAGEAVGINAAMSIEGQGIGFAVPINVAREILDQLRRQGHVTRGYLGIQLSELEPDLQKLVGYESARGALVIDVMKGSAGEAAGLKRYDVVTAVSGESVADGDHLIHLVSSKPPGSDVSLTVFREGRTVTLHARLTARENTGESGSKPQGRPSPEGDALGLVVSELGRETATRLEIPADRMGVVVRDVVGLAPGVEALVHGDVIVEVNRRPTRDLSAYSRAVAALRPGETAWLFVYRPRPGGSFLTKVEVERP